MRMVIIECDACHAKNRTTEDKIAIARCGKCGNPLMDAYAEQFGGGEEDEGLDFEGEEGDDED